MDARKILIVDDDRVILELLEKKLSASGYQVVRAATGAEALQKAREARPSLILMDIMLPDIDGPEVVSMLKKDSDTETIPVIFLSGIVSRDDSKKKIQVTVAGFSYDAIPKPFDFDELLKEIRKVLR